jgi:unspecific monooxygenase
MFSIAHSRPHSIRKRMISNLYSKSYLQSSPELDQISQTLIFTRLLPTLFNAAAAGTPVDVLPLNYATAADFITAYLFGLHNSSSFIQDLSSRAHFLDLYHSRKTYSFWYQELPKTASILHSIGLRVVPRFVDAANREIEAWCLKMCTAASAEPSASISPTSTPPVVYSQLRRALKLSSQKEPQPDPNGRRQDLAIASEMLDHLAAGQETSGITLTYLMHELSLQPALQARLRTELLTLSPPLLASGPNPSTSTTAAAALPTLPSPRAIDALPILAALVLETLRLHAAIPGPQPRVTGPVPCALAGVGGIPAGVRVAAMAHGLHRNADVFPEPDRWRPDRWLVGGERRAEMGRWFWAFGSGGRMCVGSNFALLGERALFPLSGRRSLLMGGRDEAGRCGGLFEL